MPDTCCGIPQAGRIRLAMSGVAFITTNDLGQTDAALVLRFKQAQTERERTAVFADVIRHHGEAVLGCCAQRLWPDADAAVAAAGDVLIAARLAMADSAKLARPDRLRDWLLGIAVYDGLPARIDDIDWEAVQAHDACDTPGTRDSLAGRPSLRPWLEQIVATLPEARQRLYDLFVARGLNSRIAARELGTNVAGVRRLRGENRQAILRAFEITALAAEAALDPLGGEAPECGELRQILADAPRDGDAQEGVRRHAVVLPAALRLTVTRHVSLCGACQDRRDDCMARWAPELLPILAGTELNDQVMEVLHPTPESAQSHAGAGAHRRPRATPAAHKGAASVRGAWAVVARPAAAAAGTGVLAALLLLGFVWPGFLHGAAAFVPRSSATSSSQDPGSGGLNGGGAPQMIGTYAGVPGHDHGRPVPRGTAGLLGTLPAQPSGSWFTAPSSPSASATPPLVYTVQPSTSPTSATSSPAQPTSGPTPTSSPAPSPSPSATQPTPVPSTSATSPAPSTPPPTTAPPTTAPPSTPPPSTSAPSPSASASASATASPSSPAPSTPAPS